MSIDSKSIDSLYPMRVVTRLTGLSAHTIRVWERRYGAVTPVRTGGNSRRYSAEDVRRLGLLKEATDLGYKIMNLAELENAALEELVAGESKTRPASASPAPKDGLEQLRNEYLESIRRFDARSASELLGRAAMLLEPTVFVFDVVLPILRETGLLWAKDDFTVAHEHLVTFQMRGLMDTLLRLSSPHEGAPRILVATPEGFLHEFGALAGALLAAARGFEPVYLGSGVPIADLMAAVQSSRADLLLLGVLHKPDAQLMESLNAQLARLASLTPLWVGLPPDHPNLGAVPGVRYFDRFEDLDLALTQRAALPPYSSSARQLS